MEEYVFTPEIISFQFDSFALHIDYVAIYWLLSIHANTCLGDVELSLLIKLLVYQFTVVS